jgi:hypothetical protein
MNTTALQNPVITLEWVKSQFHYWRQNRHCKSNIPDKLWNYAIQLYPQHNCYQITKALQLDHSKLKSKLISAGITFPHKIKKPSAKSLLKQLSSTHSFTECLLAEPPISQGNNPANSTLEFIRKDGSVLKLNTLPHQQLLPVISLLLGSR